ncbi:MAG: S-layer-like protein [uncultured bacterium]|nr:MAG: S-layer-like protein [uncultured bacterium]
MFDDNTTPNNNQAPSNLPIAEPDDIFSSGDDVSVSSMPVNNYPERIEDDSFDTNNYSSPSVASMNNSALGAGILKPKNNVEIPSSQDVPDMFSSTDRMDNINLSGSLPSDQPNQGANNNFANKPVYPSDNMSRDNRANETILPPPGMTAGLGQSREVSQVSEPVGNKSVIIWIVVLVVLIVLGSGSAWIYFTFIRENNTNNNAFVQPNFENNTNQNSGDNNNVNNNQNETDNNQNASATTSTVEDKQQVIVGEPLDTDGDGLNDVTESRLGTNPLNWDTDGDQLSDADEVNIWKTNPLNSDTDGDTYQDGVEIKNGYSPVGTGKLFEPPTTNEETANSTTTSSSTVSTTVK